MNKLFTTALLTGLMLLATACNSPSSEAEAEHPPESRPAGSEQTLQLDAITGIRVFLPAEVTLTPGDRQEVRIQAPREVLDDLVTEVQDGIWTISTRNRVGTFTELFRGEDDIKVYIQAPRIDRVELSSSGSVRTTAPYSGEEKLRLELSGSGDIAFQGTAEAMTCILSGSGNIHLEGSTQALEATISGSGSIECLDLETRTAKVEISGSGDCRLHVLEVLEAEVSGSGEVRYKGAPQVRSKVWGSGDVSPLD